MSITISKATKDIKKPVTGNAKPIPGIAKPIAKIAEPIIEIAKPVKINQDKSPKISYYEAHYREMITKASAIVAESRKVKTIPKPNRNIHEVLKENGDQHDKIPRHIFEYAVNYGRSKGPTENKSLTFMRKNMCKYPKE